MKNFLFIHSFLKQIYITKELLYCINIFYYYFISFEWIKDCKNMFEVFRIFIFRMYYNWLMLFIKKKWKKKENKEKEKINDWTREYSNIVVDVFYFLLIFIGDKRTRIKNKYTAALLTTLLVGSNIVIKPVVIHTMRVYVCVCVRNSNEI